LTHNQSKFPKPQQHDPRPEKIFSHKSFGREKKGLTGAGGNNRRVGAAAERFPRVGVALGQEVISAVKAGSVETIVRAEGDAEGALVRLDFELLELAAVPRVLAVATHVIGELDVVAGGRRLAPATRTPHFCFIHAQ